MNTHTQDQHSTLHVLPNEEVFTFMPSLAAAIGIKEAIFLTRIFSLFLHSVDVEIIEGEKWIGKSYEEWQRIFTFCSTGTISTVLSSLKSHGLIEYRLRPEFGAPKRYYRIRKDALQKIVKPIAK